MIKMEEKLSCCEETGLVVNLVVVCMPSYFKMMFLIIYLRELVNTSEQTT